MALEFGVIALVLLAAALHATWNALAKAGNDRLVFLAVMHVAAGGLGLIGAPFVAFPDPASWPYLLISIAVHQIYFWGLIYAYEHGDLSQVYPIARGSAPMLVALGAWWLAAETLSLMEWAGVVVVSAGIISLAWRRGAWHDGELRAIGFALVTALTIAAYSIADGIGVRRAGDEIGYIIWLFVIDSMPVFLYALWRRRGRIRASFGPVMRTGLIGGALSGLAYGIVIWAMSLGPMAHIIALRETSVVIAALIGTLILKEPFGRQRVAAAVVVATGAVLLNAGL